jgi:hypothetical protein
MGEGKDAEAVLGEGWAKDFRDTKTSLERLTVADDVAAKAAIARGGGQRDYLTLGALGGAAMGILHGSSPIGLASGLATSIAHHYVAARGASTAAVALDRIAQIGAVRRAVIASDREVQAGVRQIVGSEGARAPSLHENPGSYEDKRKMVTAAVTDPERHKASLETATGPLAAHAPETAEAFRTAALNATKWLASQLPSHAPLKSLTPQPKGANMAAPDEQAAFVRKFDAVHDPVSVLQAVHTETITPDQIEALSATHPDWLADARQKLTSELGESAEPMSQARKESITTFLGQPVDETTSPDFGVAMQAAFGPPPPPPTPGPAGKPGRKTGMGANKSGVHTGEGAPRREIKSARLTGLDSPYGSSAS